MDTSALFRILAGLLFIAAILYYTLSVQTKRSWYLDEVITTVNLHEGSHDLGSYLSQESQEISRAAQLLLENYTPEEIDAIGVKCRREIQEMDNFSQTTSTIKKHQRELREISLLNLLSSVEVATRSIVKG